jgi:hypothetical protein
MSETPIPTNPFSRELRSLRDNPGAVSSASTIHTQDFYGNSATWVLETFRDGDGDQKVFIQKIDELGGARLVLPPEVTAALARHRDQLSTKVRRRQGHRLVAQRRERGDVLGNPAALAAARKASKGRHAAKGLGLDPDVAGVLAASRRGKS